MANQLKMAEVDAILALHRRRWSIRQIAKALGIHRDTVSRYVRGEPESNQARAPIGSSADQVAQPPITTDVSSAPASDSNQARAPLGSTPGAVDPQRQPSLCEPWRPIILDKLQAGLTAQRI